jgi:hemerythrin
VSFALLPRWHLRWSCRVPPRSFRADHKEHERISLQLARLASAILVDNPGHALRATLVLMRSVWEHFAREESLMHAIGYDGLDWHKRARTFFPARRDALRLG